MESLISKYLQDTKSPNFNNFVKKNEQKIISLSTKTTNTTNAFKLMTLWINKYNKTVRGKRPMAQLQKKLKTATVNFKGIYKLMCAQKTADQIIEADSYKTSTAYVLKTNKILRDSINTSAENEQGEGESEGEPDDYEGERNEDEDEDEQNEEEDEDEGEQQEDEGDQSEVEERDEDGIRGRLMDSLTNKLKGKSYDNSIIYIAQDKNNLAQLLLQEASETSRLKKISSIDLEFWKLALSSTINLMHPSYEARLSKLFTKQQLAEMKHHMNKEKTAFQKTKVTELIDSLFDSLLPYQLDANTDRVIDFIDEEKYKEKDKKSEHYKLLKLVWITIINFERLRSPNATEAVFSSNFELLLTIMFQGDNIFVESGETVSDATSRAAAANSHSISDFGRKIDVLVHNSCYNIRNEYCCIEFKRQDAKTKLLTYQQSKSIRINGALLNDLNAKINAKINANDIYLVYMDFWGTDGYISGLKLFQNAYLVDQISTIHLPIDLIELEDFRSSLKYLFQWREHILQQSRRLALGVFKEKRKYESVDISRPSSPRCRTPERESSTKPLDMYFSPQRNKKSKEN